MIEAVALTKRYGSSLAVDGLSFTVPPGQVTGFLGPNGAGKSTTMRMILGLDAPTSGWVTVDGRPYSGYRRPLRQLGALRPVTPSATWPPPMPSRSRSSRQGPALVVAFVLTDRREA